MNLIGLLVALIVLGVLFWAAHRILAVLPLEEPFRTIIYVVLVVVAVLICVQALFGVIPWTFGGSVYVPRVR